MLWKAAKGIAKTPLFLARGVRSTAKAAYGMPGFGLIGLTSGKQGLMARLALPGLLAGGFAMAAVAESTLGAPYDMYSPRAAWGYSPGNYSSYTEGPMNFRGAGFNLSGNATGDLALALHNTRKA